MKMARSTLRLWWLVFGAGALIALGLQLRPASVPTPSIGARTPVRAYQTILMRSTSSELSVDLNVTNMPAVSVHQARTPVFMPPGFSFDPFVTYPTGNFSPVAIAVADISGDGRSDVVVATLASGSPDTDNAVLVYRQAEDGTLLAPDRYQYTDWTQDAALAIDDLDHDGDQDIVVGYDHGLTVLLNGPGGMSTQVIENDDEYRFVAALDVNGDGFKDIAAVNHEYGTDLFLNDGMGVLTAGQHVATARYVRQVSVGDMTGDGLDDLVVQTHAELFIYPTGGGGLGTPQKLTYPVAGTDPYSHVLADFNGDGRLDVGMNDDPYTQSYIRVYLRNVEGNLAAGWAVPTAYDPQALAVADLDGNGRYDLVSMHQTGPMGYYLQGVKGLGAAVTMQSPGNTHYRNDHLTVGDVIGDDCQDVVVVSNSSVYGISIYRGRNCSHYPIRTPPPPLPIPPRH